MAAQYAASAIICSGTTTIPGVVDIAAVVNNATTSFTIAKGANVILSGGVGSGQSLPAPLRSANGLTITVVGGGSVTLLLAVSARR
jgi:hypothetical protein